MHVSWSWSNILSMNEVLLICKCHFSVNACSSVQKEVPENWKLVFLIKSSIDNNHFCLFIDLHKHVFDLGIGLFFFFFFVVVVVVVYRNVCNLIKHFNNRLIKIRRRLLLVYHTIGPKGLRLLHSKHGTLPNVFTVLLYPSGQLNMARSRSSLNVFYWPK